MTLCHFTFSIVLGDSALHLAVVNGDLPAVKYLVSKGADINHRTTKNLFEKETAESAPMEKQGAGSKYKGLLSAPFLRII